MEKHFLEDYYEEEHKDDHHEEDLPPFFEDSMDIYAVGTGLGIILFSLIGAILLYKFKKDQRIKTSIFR